MQRGATQGTTPREASLCSALIVSKLWYATACTTPDLVLNAHDIALTLPSINLILKITLLQANPQNLRRHIAVCHTGAAAGQPHQVSRRHSTGGAVGKPGTSPGNKRPKSAKVFVCALCPAGTTFRWKGNLKRYGLASSFR